MNRRNFLKAFTGAAVGAAVLAVMPPMPEVFAEAVKAPTTEFVPFRIGDQIAVNGRLYTVLAVSGLTLHVNEPVACAADSHSLVAIRVDTPTAKALSSSRPQPPALRPCTSNHHPAQYQSRTSRPRSHRRNHH